jgi:hypothetical protein
MKGPTSHAHFKARQISNLQNEIGRSDGTDSGDLLQPAHLGILGLSHSANLLVNSALLLSDQHPAAGR